MPTDGDTPRAHRSLGKGRLEAFSDGVFAIAATLLVLDIAVQPPGTPLRQVLDAWPAYVAYLVSFLTIGAAWIAHTALTDRLERTDTLLLRLNHDDAQRVAVTTYGLTFLVIRVMAIALDAYARRERLYKASGEGAEQEREGRKNLPVVIGYVLAILIGLALPAAGIAIYFGLAVYLVVPFREVRHALFSRRT